MKSILLILCTLFLSSSYTFAADLTDKEVKQILAEAAADPYNAKMLALAFPELSEEIIYNTPNSKSVRIAIAKERSWREYACLEKDTGQNNLRSETEKPWPTQCSKWVDEYSDNPATTNSAQNEANGYADAYKQNKISYEEAQEGIDNITKNGSQIVDPMPPSGS
jgi:hypothetical protein